MTSVAERVAFLEGQSGEQIAAMSGLRHDVSDLRGHVFKLRRDMDRRFEQVDLRFDRIEERFDRRLTWIVGTQIAILLAVVGALAAPYFR